MIRRQVRLQCGFSLGDVVALTGAVREICEQYPGEFLFEPATTYPEVWLHNPNTRRLRGSVETIECDKVAIDRTGAGGRHYIGAYLDLLNNHLGTTASLRTLAGDIYLSEKERNWYSDVWTLCHEELPYWIVCSGGKFDIPIKWWSHDRYQAVVDHFKDRILFVQVGTWGNQHLKLRGTVDLRGKTDVRDLIHLLYCARGVFCGVTSLMHLAAAVPTEDGSSREAVIIAGAREPKVWEHYPGHHYFDTSHHVPCGNCWKNTHISLPDRRQNFNRNIRCSRISRSLPECMDIIGVDEVIDAIENTLRKQPEAALRPAQIEPAHTAIVLSEQESDFDANNVTPLNAADLASEFIKTIPPFPVRRFSGDGIVMCGGGVTYFTNAWVCIQMLRFLGCPLPVELWYLGRREFDVRMERLLQPLGVKCVNALAFMKNKPMRNPLGWELKSYAVLNSRFERVIYLDSDNVPLRNMSFLFQTQPFAQTGACFWPDYKRLSSQRPIWRLCSVPYRDEPEFESGQMVIDKKLSWAPLNLAFWYNDHSEFFYKYIHGDKETFHMAWRRLNTPYYMVPFPIEPLEGTMCQHDFNGTRLFQHRNLRKWQFFGDNPHVEGFIYERECLHFIDQLRSLWDGKINGERELLRRDGFSFRKGTADESIYRNVVNNNEYRLPATFRSSDTILDVGAHIGSFAAACYARGSRKIVCFEANPENANFARLNVGKWNGVRILDRAVLHTRALVEPASFPWALAGQNTGGGAVRVHPSGTVEALPLDDILRELGRVRLLKLDCEGSEWPILMFSKELGRVEEVCGEFHSMPAHPLCPGSPPLDRELMRKLLTHYFRIVKTSLDRANPKLGMFWASSPKSRFCDVRPRQFERARA